MANPDVIDPVALEGLENRSKAIVDGVEAFQVQSGLESPRQ